MHSVPLISDSCLIFFLHTTTHLKIRKQAMEIAEIPFSLSDSFCISLSWLSSLILRRWCMHAFGYFLSIHSSMIHEAFIQQ